MSTNYSADQLFANDLTRRMELGLDFGAMFGKGGEFQPLGVFTDKEVEHVDAKTLSNEDLADSNGKITADFPVFIRSKVLAKNVDDNKLGWAFNSVLEGYLMNLKTTTGAYIYRDEMNTGKLLGFPYRVSNQITTDNTGLTELAFGNWAPLATGQTSWWASRWALRPTLPWTAPGSMKREPSTTPLKRTWPLPALSCTWTSLPVIRRASCTSRTSRHFNRRPGRTAPAP